MKEALRRKMRERLRALPSDLRREKSAKIAQTILEHPFYKEADDILIYVSKGEEVETHELIKKMLEEKTLYVPKVQGEQLIICPLLDLKDLETGTYGILEHKKTLQTVHPKQLDLALVPGTAFTKKGDRLGSGHGYFDRLLREVDGHILGLAFEEQILETLPQEDHDIPMHSIITA